MTGLFVALAAAVAALALVYLILRARIDRRIAHLDPAAEIRDELAQVMVEMNRTTERNVALLEDRIAQLTQLLADADRKISLLRRESEKHETSRKVYSHLARTAVADNRLDPGGGRVTAEGATSAPAAEPPRRPGQPPSVVEESLETRVLRLEREGFSAPVIATRLGSTVGEVELIISLARRRP